MLQPIRITGKISALLGNFDYMACWGALKTREEIIGKPIKYGIGDSGKKLIVGKIVDADPTTDEWWGEIYI